MKKKGKCKCKHRVVKTYLNGGLVRNKGRALLHKGEIILNLGKNAVLKANPFRSRP